MCFQNLSYISQIKIYHLKIYYNLIELYFYMFQVFSYSFKINLYAVFYLFCGFVKKSNVADNSFNIFKNGILFWMLLLCFLKHQIIIIY